MSLMHAAGSHTGRTIQARETQTDGHGHNPAAADEAAHAACLETIRELREENESLRKSADEFAALAERLQRALVRERRRTDRDGSKGSPDRFDGNHVLTISMQIEAEFRAIPNLRLTRWQAARLWDLEQEECDAAIAALVKSRVLRETPGGFVRRDR
jgi:predicted RNase H-like nuclease (RuvC/YqgF family)